MKKLFVTALAILASGSAYALPVGNPSEASLLCDGIFLEGGCCDPCNPCSSWFESFSFRLGFYGDYVFNRHMEVRSDGPDIEDVEIHTNAAYFALNFCNRFDVFATAGATTFDLSTNNSAFGILSGLRFDLESGSACASWSVGGRATLWEIGCTTFGIEGQYFRANPDIKRITISDLISFYPDNAFHARYDEWQVGLGVSHRINIFVPYAAVKYSRARWDLGGNTFAFILGETTFTETMRDLENKKSWGYAVGVSLIACEKAALTVEGRFADEKALYVNGQVRF